VTEELLGRVYGVRFQRLVDPAAPETPAAWVPAGPL
jgi:hypothetical protein